MKNGIDYYENHFEKMIKGVLDNSDPIVTGYYYYIIGKSSLSTSYNYVKYVDRFLKAVQKDIKDLDIDDYTIFLSRIRKYTPSYQRTIYFALKRFSEYLHFTHRNESHPMQYVSAPKNYEEIQTKQKRDNGFLTKNETKILFQTIENGIGNHNAKTKQENWKERDLAIILILLTTGMRRSALYKLDIDNIDLEKKRIITIDKGSKINEFLLTEDTYNILVNWISKRKVLLKDNANERALFISNRKKRMNTESIANIVKKYSANIEGKHITPHKLRATYGTQLYNETRDIKFVQDRMMHSNPKTTELYIRGNGDEDRKKAADIMANFLK